MFAPAFDVGGAALGLGQPADELALCRRIASGERHLFARIVEAHMPLVAGAIAAQGVAREDVEDLAQIAFVNVFKGIGGFRGESKLSSWMYRIAVNVARAHLKRLAQHPAAASVEEQAESGVLPADEQSDSSPRELVQQRALSRAMGHLSESQRACLGLFYFEELSYEEIAAALRMNLNTVRTHIRRGKLRLAELLDESVLD